MKFSIVTPAYNSEKYIAETIESVISQEGDFEIEYIIQDGGSTDKTLEIIALYTRRVSAGEYPVRCKKITIQYFSEKDAGMYDAIEKGFKRSTGNIMAYINADDVYLPGAFATVSAVFSQLADIEWLKGINTTANEQGERIKHGVCLLYNQSWLQKGIYGRGAYFVHQDSVFWRKSLWEKANPDISRYRLAGDYALWIAFAKYAPLWSYNKQVSAFRKRKGQLSDAMDMYRKEQENIAPHHPFLEKRVVIFFLITRFFELPPHNIFSRLLFFLLFPFYEQQWYIDFDMDGNPTKKKAVSYAI